MKNIKAIIFDLGGIFLNISYQKTINEFTKLGIKNSSSFYCKESQNNLFDLFEIGGISEHDFISKIKNKCDSASANEVRFAWNAMLLDFQKKSIELLTSLKKRHLIFLLSNTNTIHLKEFKKILGVNQYNKFINLFNHVYYSHEIGLRKPNKEAFQIILEENSLTAKNVLFVDDSKQHIDAAKRIGIRTHHLLENESITDLFPDIIL
tara:strand:+ start:8659 stop:9279 length:621 start_codon:yes stop_codon:yes gene_type:complete